MTDTSLDLASLLCSRLCHDLLSPVGAMSNGLELLAEERDPEMRARVMDLLEQSAKTSADKLKFFRLAFGAAGGFDSLVPVDEARALIVALAVGGGRTEVEWAVSAPALPKAAIKVLLNLAHIGLEALVRGGTLQIGAEARADESGRGSTEIAIRASGPRIAFDPAIGQALDGTLPGSEVSSRTAPAAMIRRLAEGQGGGLQFALGAEALVLGAVLPDA